MPEEVWSRGGERGLHRRNLEGREMVGGRWLARVGRGLARVGEAKVGMGFCTTATTTHHNAATVQRCNGIPILKYYAGGNGACMGCERGRSGGVGCGVGGARGLGGRDGRLHYFTPLLITILTLAGWMGVCTSSNHYL